MLNVFFLCQMSSLIAVAIAQEDKRTTTCMSLSDICKDGKLCLENTHGNGKIKCHCDERSYYNEDSRSCEVDTFQNDCGTIEQICENGRVCKDIHIKGMMTCKCDVGFRYSSDSKSCEAVKTPAPHSCIDLENHCVNGRPCLNTSEANRPVSCECDDGFMFNSATRECEAKSDDCVRIENFCENGRICTDIKRDGVITCKCDAGFHYNRETGTCEEDTMLTDCVSLVNPCRNGRICIDDTNSSLFRCECKDGFRYNLLTGNCEDIDECSEVGYVCSEGHCQIINRVIKCTCNNEKLLEGSALCDDINECTETRNPCQNGECINTEGSYSCQCYEGFQLTSGGICRDINECTERRNPCQNGKCINTEGSYSCQCFEGFQLTAGGICQDKNECTETRSPCQNGDCINTEGSYSCQCFEGYQLTSGGICRAIPTTNPTTKIKETPTTPQEEASSVTTSKQPSSESSVLDKYQSESSKIPLPAIVVPVILIIVGFGLLGVFLWRKGCRGNKKADQDKTYCKNNQIMVTNGSHIENLQNRDSAGAAYNCGDKEPENVYIEIIDTADVIQHTQTEHNSLKDHVNEISQIDKHDYHILEVQDAHTSVDNDSASCIINRNRNTEATYQTYKNEMHKDIHDYCVLEPEYTHLSSDPSKQSSKPKTGQSDVPRNQTLQSSEQEIPKVARTSFLNHVRLAH